MTLHRLIGCTALAALVASFAAPAATPASGTLSAANRTLTYTSGPFAAQNNSAVANPACTGSGLPVTSSVDCDDYALTVDLPADWRATHPRDLVLVNVRWPVANFDAYGLYVLDASGTVIDYKRTERDPVTVSIPAGRGVYTLRIVPLQPSPEILNATVTLLADQTGTRAAGPAPRFIPQPTPANLGNELEAEMNIGYNPRTQRAFTLGFTHTLRTTFGDAQSPPQPECCDALWDEVSDPNSQVNTNDPILFTDQATGRTFVSQLQPALGHSIFLYTDDDGAHWTQSPTTANGGIDHQSVGAGPYSATLPAGAMPSWPATGSRRAVYFCSQSVAAAFCIRSDDGGDTFTGESVLVTAADCDGWTPYIHGHVKVAPDGTVYVPLGNCGGQPSLIVSQDSGFTWQVRRLPGVAAGDGDPSVGIGADGTVYFCYISGDGHAHAAVTRDHGNSWRNDRDIGYAKGVVRAVFPSAVAGDPDRAACAFIGTSTPGGNFQNTDFQGVWYPYLAMTYDGGLTWHTVNATPDDPVQGRGGIALGGATAIENRNLLDFNEITLDEKGRVLFAFDDGCVAESCILTGTPRTTDLPTFVNILTDIFAPGAVPAYLLRINDESKATILRQSGGRSLYRTFDDAPSPQLNSVAPVAPAAACLNGSGRDATRARLVWKVPDNGGDDIVGYKVYRGTAPGTETFVASANPTVFYDDTATSPLITDYYYRIAALNSRGEGPLSNAVKLAVGSLPAQPNSPPVARLATTPASGTFPLAVHFDAGQTRDADGDAIRKYVFDFGDGSDVVSQAGASIDHTYATRGSYVATVKAVDAFAHRSQNAGRVTISEAITTPAAFTFAERTGVAPGVMVSSASVTITGINVPVAVRVSDGQYRIDGGAFTGDSGTLTAGQTLQVRHLSASTPGAATVSTITVGTYSTAFRSTTTATLPHDDTPDAFTFIERLGVATNVFVTSEARTIAGIDAATSVSVANGQYSLDGGAFTSTAGTLGSGQSLRVRQVSATAAGTWTTSTVTVGTYSAEFRSQTSSLDRTPEAFGFATQSGVEPGTTITSEVITLAGFNTAVAVVPAAGLDYSVNDGAFTHANGTLNPGDTLQVRHTSTTTSLGYTKTSIKAGGVTGYFTTRTR